MSLAAIILAAGASSRMGQPKPLLEYRGETFLDRLIGLYSARCAPVVVVLGSRAAEIRARVKCEARFVTNANWEEGMLGSLQCGLRELPEDLGGFAFTPVDSPRLKPETLELLGARFEARNAEVIVPRFAGRRGHPVLCSAALRAEFLALPPGGQPRQVVHRHLNDASYVDVDDAGVIEDIDDPEAYRALLAKGVRA